MKLDIGNLAKLVFSREKPWPYEAFEPAPERPGAGGLRLVRYSDLAVKAPEFLIDGLLETKSLGMIFGPSGSGKSFLGISVAGAIATGSPWYGRAVAEGGVIYVAGEGLSGISRRLRAWEIARGVDLAKAPLFVSSCAAQLNDKDGAAALMAQVKAVAQAEGDPALVIIDTVNRNFGPGDENSTADMTRFIDAMAAIRDQFGCSVVAIHHSGKDASLGARGSSALRAAMDFEAGLGTDKRGIRFWITKTKEAPLPDEPMRFQLRAIDLGEAGSSAVLEVDDAQGPREPGDLPKAEDRLSKGAQAGLAAFQAAARKNAADADGRFDFVSLEAWRVEFYATSTAEPDAQRKAFGRAREDLVKAGRLKVDNNIYSLTNGIEAGFLASAIRAERAAAGVVEPLQGEGDPEAQGDPGSDPAPGSEALGDPAAAPSEPVLGGDPAPEEIPIDGKTSSPAPEAEADPAHSEPLLSPDPAPEADPEAATLAEALERLGKAIKSP